MEGYADTCLEKGTLTNDGFSGSYALSLSSMFVSAMRYAIESGYVREDSHIIRRGR